jgi:hypothetical protein
MTPEQFQEWIVKAWTNQLQFAAEHSKLLRQIRNALNFFVVLVLLAIALAACNMMLAIGG